MSQFKLCILAGCLSGATVLSGCVSTTTAGTISPNRKQLMLYSSSDMSISADKYYFETLNEVNSKGTLDVNPQQVNRVRRVANNLIPYTTFLRQDAVNWDWRVHVINEDKINAYVMPNAKIIFYSGIIDNLNLHDGEIAAIMGHEIAHALREHSREKLSQKVATGTVISLAGAAFGLAGSALQALAFAGAVGIDLPHSRSQESEADKIGLELMARAGYHPRYAVTLWQKIEAYEAQKKGVIKVPFLSTHPSSTNRVTELQTLQGAVMPLYEASTQKHEF